jgi:hypothetical protein
MEDPKIDENKKELQTWTSCCLKSDRQATVYFGQLAFSFAVLAFSAGMLVVANGDCNKSSPYIGLISFLLGKLLSTVTDSGHR